MPLVIATIIGLSSQLPATLYTPDSSHTASPTPWRLTSRGAVASIFRRS